MDVTAHPQIVYLALGGNVGDVAGTFERALVLIGDRVGTISRRSSLYSTRALTLGGAATQPDYLNAVIEVASTLKPEEILRRCLDIENVLGRERNSVDRWAPRVIDIDVLLIDEQCIESATLVVPHPEMARRDFVLAPLSEIAPAREHPRIRRSMRELLDALDGERFVLSMKAWE